MIDYIVPGILFLTCAIALGRKENSYRLMLQGGSDGLKLVITLIPTWILLLTAVSMFRASGAADTLCSILSPVFRLVGIPPETGLLVIIRPISGSAALAVGTDLMHQYGVDSAIGKTVAVMLGSTETTFYAISTYCGAAGIQKTRYILPAALIADMAGFITASFAAKLLI